MKKNKLKNARLTKYILGFIFVTLWITVYLAGIPQIVEKRATEPACPVNGATCAWDKMGEGISYNVEIYDYTDKKTVAKGKTSKTSVTFHSVFGHRYRCSVTAENSCGAGPEAFKDETCNISVSLTPISPPVGGVPTDVPSVTQVASSTAKIENDEIPVSEMRQILKLPETGIGDINNATPSGNTVTPEAETENQVEKETEPEVKTEGSVIRTGTAILAICSFIFFIAVLAYYFMNRLKKRNEN